MADTSRPRRATPSTLRDRTRQAMRAEVSAVAFRLFAEQGFDKTTVDQIAAEAGLSRATFFRYFGTKEDVVLGDLEDLGRDVAGRLAERPADERPWDSLRRAFDALTDFNADEPENALAYVRMLYEAPSLKARHWEKQQAWQELLVPEVARRLGTDPAAAEDPRARALVSSALACKDAATDAWTACNGAVPLAVLIDRAMGALTA
ncbi:TetR family transcriptional regulator [Streptomyces diastatochromogenes]|uniref:TetR family transcriptional regulator n=1 Tax=Streptomyces diastatochromogenes TaxID=42236 RepID=A0A233SY65_STRDA|nr:TetR family transcriptional regulator [Streptomyces diastatochromogenes]OXZ00569.1 TetR family transcriptional regulator [Streptomyces diastatochromogenes]